MSGTILSLAVVGLILVIAEMFLPGMIAGIAGAAAFVVATILTYATYGPATGNITLLLFVVIGLLVFLCWLYVFPRSAFARKLTLNTASKAPSDHPDHSDLVGREGVAVTQLRPAGIAMIDGKRVDVVAESGFIAPDEHVKVLQAEGARVVVRKQSTSLR